MQLLFYGKQRLYRKNKKYALFVLNNFERTKKSCQMQKKDLKKATMIG